MIIDDKLINNLFLLFILFLPVSWASLSVGSVYRLITIVIFIFYLFANRFIIRIPVRKRNVFSAWSIYVFYTIISTAWGGFTSHQITISFGMIILFLISIVFLGTNICSSDVKKIDFAWLTAGVFFIFLFLTGSRVVLGWTSRQSLVIMGTPTDANEFASFFVVAISVAVILFIKSERLLVKVCLSIVMISGVYVVLMSGSRGALISTIIAVLITLFVSKRLSFKELIIISSLGIVVWLIFKNYIIHLIPANTLSRISVEAIVNDSGSGRSYIWKNAIHEFINGPVLKILFGYGYDGITAPNGYGSFTSTMHNQYIHNLIAYGLVGFSIYIHLLFVIFKEYVLYKKDYLGCFIGILVMGMTITMGPSYKIIWILMMIPMITIVDNTLEERLNEQKSDTGNSRY